MIKTHAGLYCAGLLSVLCLGGCEAGTLGGHVCEPGEIQPCPCPGNTASRQLCLANGLGWGNCDCPSVAGGCDVMVCPEGNYCDEIRQACMTESTNDGGVPRTDITYHLTETREVFPVPDDVGFMHVKAWGSGGNGEQGCMPDGTEPNGGPGGFSEAIFEVTPGEPLIVFVGWRAQLSTTDAEIMRYGFPAPGGGGLSGVFSGQDPVSATDRDRAMIIAGGGGSAGAPGCLPGGAGNHRNAGGEDTMQGSRGGDDINGGGGGYHGGRGGARGEIGRGGTGYVSEAALESAILSSEPGVNVDPPRTDDPDYVDDAGASETQGHVVIRFSSERLTL